MDRAYPSATSPGHAPDVPAGLDEERTPLALRPSMDPRTVMLATAAFVALGVLLRVVRYLLIFPLWCDETMLAANFLDRGYAGLLQPLDYRQVCPVLFLMIERTAVAVLGFSELSLRAFPFACGVAGVFLFRHVAGRMLRGEALLCAVAIFAVSAWPLRYVGEVKPYASDLFVALGLLALAVEWQRRPDRTVWLWGLVLAAPLAVALSFPAILVAGGISLALLVQVWRQRRRDAWLAYVLFNAAIGLTFLALLRFYETAPHDRAYFHRDWAPAFPPLHSAWKLCVWFLANNTGYTFAYPEGGASGASVLTFLCFVAAVILLWRHRRRTILALGLAPFGLGLVAAALHRYPYGMSARTMQYVAPVICLFAGLGVAGLLSRIRAPQSRRLAFYGLCGTLAAFGFVRMGFDITHPYRESDDETHRGFARWFWKDNAQRAELVCPKVDLGLEFASAHWTKDATDTYLCYQKIYSPRHRQSATPNWQAISARHPLRCVFFNEIPDKSASFRAWLTTMLGSYELRRVERYPLLGTQRSHRIVYDNVYVVYEFVPRPGRDPARVVEISSGGRSLVAEQPSASVVR